MIIAIDGPAGSGKSTVARAVSQRLGYQCIDTGAMYRAVTWKALKQEIDLESEKELALLMEKSRFRFLRSAQNELLLELNGVDVTSQVREQEVSENVSRVSRHPAVRKSMVEWQRKLAQGNDVVIEGRDIGTVVFPEADLKFFIEGKLEIRIQRRFEELHEKNPKITLQEVEKELKARDYLDSHREVSPLTKPPGAVYIDTTSLTIGQVVEEILRYVL